ncbi:putative inactive cysteine synthase 2 [Leguminivora glycinivorella]|uniref:putative inactive cysteine synthase 2 n=1 Tax=Leguminivora glycinivorella TaxID=1035111 RepID=UPI00200D2A0D|nr:putative inactive cysteine synthase 2 [Leguminivora glycinivorella]
MAPSRDNEIKSSALELIGNTPIVALDRLYSGPGRILAKCEFMNPGGSIKCRSSLYMIQNARKNGDLKPGSPVLEVTSGNQGTGLAVVCAVLGHPLTLTMSKGNSVQRAIHMEALGAKCVRVPQVEGTYGKVTLADVEAAEKEGLRLVDETGAFLVNQFHNEANVQSHYDSTGPEIWRQTGGKVDAFVATVGTAGTFTGVSKYLKDKNPEIVTYVVEPEGAEPIAGKAITKPCHLLQGSGYGAVPGLFKFEYMDGTMNVSDEEAVHYKKLLGEKEGLYVGYTSGANVAAAVKLLKSGKLPKDAWVVTMLNDTGLKYTPVPDELTK